MCLSNSVRAFHLIDDAKVQNKILPTKRFFGPYFFCKDTLLKQNV